MTVFTIIGLLVFWLACFELGHFLAWAVDTDGIVMACARVLVGSEMLEQSLRAFLAGLNWKEVQRG
jgi:hypothetical protein